MKNIMICFNIYYYYLYYNINIYSSDKKELSLKKSLFESINISISSLNELEVNLTIILLCSGINPINIFISLKSKSFFIKCLI